MKKAIVTGANGFVGTALCEELCKQGVQVIAVVRSKMGLIRKTKDLPGLTVVCLELSRFRNMAELITDRDIDILYHLAWEGSAGELRGDSGVQINNIRYACDTVKACADMGVKRFVFAASIMEYEINAVMATDSTPGINTLYASAKTAADYMARAIAGSLGIDYIRAVISNIYGPGEMSPRLINTSLKKMILGEHCAFSAGEQLYDFIYIDDAARAFALIGEKGKANRTYYIGSQECQKLKYFLTEMKNQVAPEMEIGLGELPFHGVSLSYEEFDRNAVKDDTGFVPQVSFAEGIRNTVVWLQEVMRNEEV